MGRRVQLREVTDEERQAVVRLARARTAPARAVERAQVVLAALEGAPVEEIAARLHVARNTVYLWRHRFAARGRAGLEDARRGGRRGGRPPTYTGEQVGEVVAAALTDPPTLGLPFQSWTLDRLGAYLAEQRGIAMKRSRLGEVLLTAGVRWRKQERWFGARVDPAFAEKRGRPSRSPRRRQRAASASASTSWDRRQPRVSPASS